MAMRFPYATVIYTTKWQMMMQKMDATIVDAYSSARRVRKYAFLNGLTVREDIKSQCFWTIVDEFDCLIQRLIRDDGHNRAEDLFMQNF